MLQNHTCTQPFREMPFERAIYPEWQCSNPHVLQIEQMSPSWTGRREDRRPAAAAVAATTTGLWSYGGLWR